MKTYVINLDRRPDRLEHFQAMAAARGFDFIRIAAVDGNDPEFVARAATAPSRITKMPVGPYGIACFESHRKVWRTIFESGDPHGLVLEDDVVLAEDFGRLWTDDAWIPADADFVRLETYMDLARYDPEPATRVLGRGLHRVRSSVRGTGAYVVSRKIVPTLLTETEGFHDLPDVALFFRASPLCRRLVIYQMVPAPAVQGNQRKGAPLEDWAMSDLHEEREGPDSEKPDSHTGLRRFKLYWRARYWLRRVDIRLRRLREVPFG